MSSGISRNKVRLNPIFLFCFTVNGEDHVACFVLGEYPVVLGGGIIEELEAFFHR